MTNRPFRSARLGTRGASLAVLGVVACARLVHGDVWYVDAGAVGAATGRSWADAFPTVAPAFAAAAAGDEVWIARGAYSSGAELLFPGGVAVYGGFVAGQTSLAARDWVQHPTILNGPGFSGAHHRVLLAANPAPGTRLDGVTVRGGYPVFEPGGGLLISGGEMRVSNCTFADNYVAWTSGGGVHAADASVAFENCRFTGNYAHLASGGAMAFSGATAAWLTDCVISGNTAVTSGSGGEGQGAGIYNSSTLPVDITRCTFSGNIGRSFYQCLNSGQYAWGGGIDSFADGLTVRDCVFVNNQAHYGAGLFAWGDTTVINSIFHHNTSTTVCVQSQTAGGEGAGIGGLSFSPATLTVINCTIAANAAREGAGLNTYYSMSVLLRNSVVWGNTATGEDVEPLKRQVRGDIAYLSSCVQDLFTVVPGEDPPDPAHFPGCIDADPLMAGAPGGNLRLSVDSPCIDAADPALLPVGVFEDLDGRHRAVRGLPGPGPAHPDMGAYEHGADVCRPVITAPPSDAAACAGEPAAVSLLASGAGLLRYRWTRDGAELRDDARVTGAAGPSLVITPSLPSDSGWYTCRVSNACGEVASLPAMVTIESCGAPCDPDVNCDGVPDQGDVACIVLAVAGDMSCYCQADPDFNRDGVPDQGDVGDLILAVAGAPCP